MLFSKDDTTFRSFSGLYAQSFSKMVKKAALEFKLNKGDKLYYREKEADPTLIMIFNGVS